MSVLDNLSKQDNGQAPRKPSGFEAKMRRMRRICLSLNWDNDQYEPEKTIESISEYISEGERILYSEFSSFVFNAKPDVHDRMESNLEKLRDYSFDLRNTVSDNIQRIVVKLWDHFYLATYQVRNAEEIIESNTIGVKDELSNEFGNKIKELEREYVTILGIFASILVTFVGGLTFSTSILNNMHNSSIYRVLAVSLTIGLVLINVLYSLFWFIDRLVRKNEKPSMCPLWISNIVIIVLMIILWGFWLDGTIEDRNVAIAQKYTITEQITEQMSDTQTEIDPDSDIDIISSESSTKP